MLPWSEIIDPIASQNGFAGVVSVDRGGEIEFVKAYGLAHRAHQIPNTASTRFAIASGSKGLTALTVVSLIKDNALSMSTTARSVLGTDLPLIGSDVTIEHLLAHRSGIGDYLDEEAGHEITDYVLTVPAQDLAVTEQYLTVLDGHPVKFPAGERFCYCNGGYVILALIAERVSGAAFHQLVRERVCVPAGMTDTEFLRSDELPGRTAADITTFWQSLFTGKIVPAAWVAEMVRARSDVPSGSMRYGLGFWLGRQSDSVILEGFDAGVSFRSVHDPKSNVTHTVISNSSDGAWPITKRLDELLAV